MKRSNHKKLARALATAGDPARLQLLCALFKHPNSCVSELAAATGGSVAITSHHLRSLAAASLLTPARSGKRICYKLRTTALVRDLKNFICHHL